ncbi:ketimine reductase mu-crystallin [Arctopsyche grandis]|uniref:ketimine reductase mu-crystallin n=1 Tax=Arctopsyche grandis TaxID=121162 RepID=UPI00406D7A53
MSQITFLDEDEVENLLKWDEVIAVVRQALIAVSVSRLDDDDAKIRDYKDLKMTNPKRIFASLHSNKGFMLCMPGYVEGFELNKKKESALSCKILNIFKENSKKVPPLPSISGYLFLFDDSDGKLYSVMGAERITEWRTAAVTCIATKLLWNKANITSSGQRRILAIFGAGVQGRIHAIALQSQFHFDEIRIWNRTTSRAERLVEDLKTMKLGADIKLCVTGEECAQEADVIVTATNSTAVLVQDDWVKAGALVNGVGVGPVSELSPELYKRSDVYVEDFDLTKAETPNLMPVGELGQLELGLIKKAENPNRVTIFQSRGMGIHDAVVGKMIYRKWLSKNVPKVTEV